MLATLPVLMALSWVPATATPAPAPAEKPAVPTASAETITCPLTGEKISPCCCPVKK